MKSKLWGMFIALLILAPLGVQAQTDSALILSLQKQILQLLTQIQTLQKEVTELKTETGIQAPTVSPFFSLTPVSDEEAELPEFTRSLSLGSRGDDVRKLQEFLARDKEIYPEGLATGFYGPRTVEAVRRWQKKNNVEAVGTVGPKTMAKFRELGQGVVQGLIQQGTPSGVVPPGLMMTPGIQKQLYPNPTTTTPYLIATATPTLASTTPESIATITPQPLSSSVTSPVSYIASAGSPWIAKTISRVTDGGIPVVASNNALIPDQLKYLIAWVGTGGNSIQTALTDRNGDPIVTPRAIYSPGFNIWKDISLIWNGEEYGLGLAVNQADGWKVYLVRIDSQGNFISSDLIGSGGSSSNAGPAIAWDGSNYALAWNPPSNDGVFLARYSPSTKKNTLLPTRVMKSTYKCDTAISWNGILFGIVCNSDYLAVNSQGSVVVAPVMGPCTWGTDPVPGWAGHPSIVWDGSRFQIAFRDYWRAGTYRWYGVPIGSINPDGKNASCYGSAHGVEYPVTYTSMALAPNARSGGQHGLGRVWLDNNKINFEEFLIVPGTTTTTIPSRVAIIGEPATAVGNIVWATDTYAAVWRNDSGIQLSFWPYTPLTTAVAPPTTISTNVPLKVLSPNGGEQWYQGNTYSITWQNPLPNGFVGHENFRWNIALSRRGVESWQLGQVPITYSYFDWKNWTFARSIPDGSDFKMQVGLANIKCQERLNSGETLVNIYCGLPSYVSVPAAGTWDDSDSTFSISSTPPPTSTSSVTITTTSPTPTTTTSTTSTSTSTTTQSTTSSTYTPGMAPIISAVVAGNISASGATITWVTDKPTDSQIEYGLNNLYGNLTTLDTSLVTSHFVTLTGLNSNTIYHYRVKSKDASGYYATMVDYSFTTLPSSSSTDTTPPAISNIQVPSINKKLPSSTDPSETWTTITWTTDEPANGQVEYGLTTTYGSLTQPQSSLATSHTEYSVYSPNAGTTYHFRVKSKDASGNLAISSDYTFNTPASSNPPNLELYPPVPGVISATVNQQFSADFRITNASAVAIPNFAPEYTVGSSAGASDISYGSYADVVFQTDTHYCPITLGAYSSCGVYFKLTYKTAGQKRFYVNIDPQNKITETSETDNTRYGGINITDSTATTTAAVIDSLGGLLKKLQQLLSSVR